LLLEALADNDIGGYSEEWNKLVRKRWSKLSRTNYEHTIGLIRKVCDGEALWKIEYYWQGYQ